MLHRSLVVQLKNNCILLSPQVVVLCRLTGGGGVEEAKAKNADPNIVRLKAQDFADLVLKMHCCAIFDIM